MDHFKRSRPNKSASGTDGFISSKKLQNPQRPVFRSQPTRPKLGTTPKMDGFVSARSLEGAQRSRQRPTFDRHHSAPANPVDPDQPLPTSPIVKQFQFSAPKKKRSIRSIIKRSAIFTVVGVFLIGGFLAGKGFLKFRDIFKGGGLGALALKKNIDPTQLKGEGDGRVNILLLGKGGPGHAGADLTDTILIASIDPIQKEASLLSLPRDFYVTHPAGGKTKINAVYTLEKQRAQARGGNEETIERDAVNALETVVKDITGIPIHYYMMVDFKAFEDAINAVGGITFDVDDPVYEKMSYQGKIYTLDVKTGLQQFDGLKALMYSRSRYTSARGDFDRAERQRKVIIALKERVLSLGTFTNPAKLNELIDAFGDHVQTDFSQSEILRVYEIGREIDSSKIASLSLVDPPNDYLTTANIGGLSVVIPKAGEGDYKAIQSFVRNAIKDAFIKSEDARIVILNGTNTTGLATTKAEELRSYGYNVTFVGSAPTANYTQTTLVDLNNGDKKYTKRYLEQRLKVTATNSLPDSAINQPGADFVIILGSNESSSN